MEQQEHEERTEKSLAPLVFQPQEPLLKGGGMMTTQAQLDREVSCSRSYLVALQYIAEMVGMDTSDAPPQGAWSVVVAVDAFVKQAGGGRPLDEVRARCGEHWINEQLARDPAISAHERAARAYYAELEKAPDA